MENLETKIVIDSDFLIDLLRGSENAYKTIEKLKDSSLLFTTDINTFELYYGAYKKESNEELTAVKGLINSLSLLSTSEDSMELAGKIAADLDKDGNPLDVRDLLIASITMVNGFSLLTRNLKHFERIEGLNIIRNLE